MNEDMWIDCIKELPKKTGDYLVYDWNTPLRQKVEIMHFNSYNEIWGNETGDQFHPAYWQPLPSPPKINT